MNAIEGKLYSPFQKRIYRQDISRDSSERGFSFVIKSETEWTRNEATVNKIRLSPGYPVKSFRELVEEVAIVTVNNKNFEMFYRGQNVDYKSKESDFYKSNPPRTVIYPTICRPDKRSDGTYKPFVRNEQLNVRYDNLKRIIEFGGKKCYQLDEFNLSLFQHYEVLPTPFVDITQSLRVAATFALRNSTDGYLYVFGLPYPNGSISHYFDQKIVLIKLQNVSPPAAYRPRYQEGYLVGKYPISPTKEAGDNLARRLVAKFLLKNKEGKFWDRNFRPMPENVLFPKDDSFEKELSKLKRDFLAQVVS